MSLIHTSPLLTLPHTHCIQLCYGLIRPPFQYEPSKDVFNAAQSGAMMPNLVAHEFDWEKSEMWACKVLQWRLLVCEWQCRHVLLPAALNQTSGEHCYSLHYPSLPLIWCRITTVTLTMAGNCWTSWLDSMTSVSHENGTRTTCTHTHADTHVYLLHKTRAVPSSSRLQACLPPVSSPPQPLNPLLPLPISFSPGAQAIFPSWPPITLKGIL